MASPYLDRQARSIEEARKELEQARKHDKDRGQSPDSDEAGEPRKS